LSTTPNEALRQPVRHPRKIAIHSVREDESIRAVFANTFIGRELPQREQTRPIERDPVRAPCLAALGLKSS
jgi:hypothetical protein